MRKTLQLFLFVILLSSGLTANSQSNYASLKGTDVDPQTNLGTPNRFVNTPQFGTITEAATPGREIQLGLRVSF
jgi:hypothetical protein